MIESTNLKMLRNLEAFQVFSDILAFLHEEEPVEEPLKGLRDTFAARLSDYDTALVPERTLFPLHDALPIIGRASCRERV